MQPEKKGDRAHEQLSRLRQRRGRYGACLALVLLSQPACRRRADRRLDLPVRLAGLRRPEPPGVGRGSGAVQRIRQDLTRISLVQDEFASVSKINTGNPNDDFSVVNEPVRGDIYLSVPDGYARTMLSFFATSKRGYVYKFACRITGNEAAQVFLSNPAIERRKPATTRRRVVSRQSPPIRKKARSSLSRRCTPTASATATR
ncbi:TraK domain-containing protein [Sphingomonas panni]